MWLENITYTNKPHGQDLQYGGNKEGTRQKRLAATHCIQSRNGWNLTTTTTMVCCLMFILGQTDCHCDCIGVQESATKVVWPRKEAGPRLRRKKDSGDGTTREKKARKTEAEMDGLCQPRHESYRYYRR